MHLGKVNFLIFDPYLKIFENYPLKLEIFDSIEITGCGNFPYISQVFDFWTGFWKLFNFSRKPACQFSG